MSARLTRRRRACWLTVLVVLALPAAACGGSDGGDTQPAEQVGTTETTADPEPVDSGEESPDPTETEPDDAEQGDAEEQELLVAPVDTTTTTAPPEDLEAGTEVRAEPEPQLGGTLRVGVEAETGGLNPAANQLALSGLVMAYPMFDPLAYFDTDGNWIPVLAESFIKIGDGTAWQMKLREGVRFHDGTELNADDVVATFNAQLAHPVLSVAYKPGFDPAEPIRKIDEYTVEFKGVRPAARLPIAFTAQLGMIAPSEWLAAASADRTLNQMPVGQGPFRIESRIQDEVTVLVRNTDYWAADVTDTYLDRIEIYPIPDTAIAAQRLIAGDLDLIVTSDTNATLTLSEAEDRGVKTVENQLSEESMLVINSQEPPFDDIRARQALTFATDRNDYIRLIRRGTAPPADTMFHPKLRWHNPDVKQETNMPERAGVLVESHCSDNPGNCTDGKINMEYLHSPSVENNRVADVLRAPWADFFNVEVVKKLQDQILADIFTGNYSVASARFFGEADPDNEVILMECGSMGGFIALNFVRYCDDERDELMYEQRGIDDLYQRVEIWHRIQEIIRDSYTYIFLNHANWVIGTRDNVHNVCGQTAPGGQELFCNIQGRVQLRQIWLS